jgi:micrococcal nuclease
VFGLRKRFSLFLIGVVILLALFVRSSIQGEGEGEGTPSLDGQDWVLVQRVVDGDTIELGDGARLRYIGLDTPEVRRRQGDRWVYDPEMFAVEATQANKALVLGKKVQLEFDAVQKDRYGRLLAYVYLEDSTFVNLELVSGGWAKTLFIPPNRRYEDQLKRAEDQARRNGIGIWSIEGSLGGIE